VIPISIVGKKMPLVIIILISIPFIAFEQINLKKAEAFINFG
jgi:hypothetical protein